MQTRLAGGLPAFSSTLAPATRATPATPAPLGSAIEVKTLLRNVAMAPRSVAQAVMCATDTDSRFQSTVAEHAFALPETQHTTQHTTQHPALAAVPTPTVFEDLDAPELMTQRIAQHVGQRGAALADLSPVSEAETAAAAVVRGVPGGAVVATGSPGLRQPRDGKQGAPRKVAML